MPKPNFLQVIITSAALGGIAILWFDFNVYAFKRMVDISNRFLFGKDAEKAIKREMERRIKEKDQEIRRRKEEEEEEEED